MFQATSISSRVSHAFPVLLTASRRPRPASFRRVEKAFTLVEMLVVMGIIVVLIGLAVPAITALRRASDVTTAAYNLMDALEQARSYAIANNTYTFFCIEEVDASQSSSATPQTAYDPSRNTGGGRVGVVVFASRDGTISCSDPNDLENAWSKDYAKHKGMIFAVVKKLEVYDNVHLGAFGQPPTSGNMARFAVSDDRTVGSASWKTSLTQFAWPLGSDLTRGQFNFNRVITFDPRGVPYDHWTSHPSIANWYELAFQQTRGNALPGTPANQNVGNQVAIMVNGVTGTNRLFRP